MSDQQEGETPDRMNLGKLTKDPQPPPNPDDDALSEVEKGSSPQVPNTPKSPAEIPGWMTPLDVTGIPTDIRAFIARQAPRGWHDQL
jgi:hypothetical protein